MLNYKTRRLHVILLTLLIAFLIMSLYTVATADTIVMKLAHIQPPTHPEQKVHEFFAKRLNELSGGKIEVVIYPSSSLGDERETIDLLSRGSLDFARESSMIMTNMTDLYQVLNLPFLFRDREECMMFVNSKEFNDLVEPWVNKNGIKTLAYYYAGPRVIYANKPIHSLADLKGLKIRLPETRAMLDIFSALGANPTPISYSELATALSTGIVDGAEGPPVSYIVNEYYRASPNLITESHMEQSMVFLMSMKSWDSLSPDLQEAVLQASKETSIKMEEMFVEETIKAFQKAEELGLYLHVPEDMDEWRKIAQDQHYKIVEKISPDLVKLLDWFYAQRK